MKQRLLNLLISLDQFVFCLITLGGSCPDETMSACAYRLEQEGKIQGRIFRPMIDLLFFFDWEHCRRAHVAEELRMQSPKSGRIDERAV